jgi:multisubunit Na+/H+ antiporter MnhB subunit
MNAAFDVLLAFLILGLAVRLLATRDLFEAVVLFVSFGLAMALVWVRLGATDVALAEAALGAGVTGALLVNGARRLERKLPDAFTGAVRARLAFIALGLAGLVAGAIGLAVVGIPRAVLPLGERVLQRVPETAVSNPVTAVLLDFRAYDTLLEMAVLVAAVLAVWALERGRPAVPAPATAETEPVLSTLVRWIVPLTIITAIYVTWVGAQAPGGAFQAGALLAGAGVLLLAAGLVQPRSPGSTLLRGATAVGLLVFTAVALYSLAVTGSMLRYPEGTAYTLILLVEAVLTLSIAAILAELFVDVPAAPAGRGDHG